MTDTKEKKRRFPRGRKRIPVHLSLDESEKEFEATVYTTDISLTGVFFASDFYLKAGTILDLEFKMPTDDRMIHTRGVIVREVRVDDERKQGSTVSGFAMRFVEYFADAKTVLASCFLTSEIGHFLDDYLARRSRSPKSERISLGDVIIAWEAGKMELGGAELDVMKDHIAVDKEGRIHRRNIKD